MAATVCRRELLACPSRRRAISFSPLSFEAPASAMTRLRVKKSCLQYYRHTGGTDLQLARTRGPEQLPKSSVLL